MARSRNIKPGLFKNEVLGVADPLCTLAFQGLWLLADREGRLEDRPLRIKAETFPYRDGIDIDVILDWLHAESFIVRYTAAEKRYIQVLNFGKHQNPHKNETASEIPAPDSIDAAPEIIGTTPEKIGSTRADSLLLIPDSLNLIPEKTSCSPSASESAKDGFADFWKAYPNKKAKPKAEAAWRKLKPSVKTVSDLIDGLERHKESEQWKRDGGQFIPHPATWLNGRRW